MKVGEFLVGRRQKIEILFNVAHSEGWIMMGRIVGDLRKDADRGNVPAPAKTINHSLKD